jgi:hypothetical protein
MQLQTLPMYSFVIAGSEFMHTELPGENGSEDEHRNSESDEDKPCYLVPQMLGGVVGVQSD